MRAAGGVDGTAQHMAPLHRNSRLLHAVDHGAGHDIVRRACKMQRHERRELSPRGLCEAAAGTSRLLPHRSTPPDCLAGLHLSQGKLTDTNVQLVVGPNRNVASLMVTLGWEGTVDDDG